MINTIMTHHHRATPTMVAPTILPASSANEIASMEIDSNQPSPSSTPMFTVWSTVSAMVEAVAEVSEADSNQSSRMTDHESNQMQISQEEKTLMIPAATTILMTPAHSLDHDRHRITHQVDQTTLRLCASLLYCGEIISFGRTCRALYATLNHPLTWTYLDPIAVRSQRQHPFDIESPFLQYCRVCWWIDSGDVTRVQLEDALTRLSRSQLPYRLVGLNILATNDHAKNAAASVLIQALLKDVRMTKLNHLSTFAICPNLGPAALTSRIHYMPQSLLSAILQLRGLRSLWILVDSFTNDIAQPLTQVQNLQSLTVHSRFQANPSCLTILARDSSGLPHSLTKLALPWMDYDWTSVFDSLVKFTVLNTLELTGDAKLVKLTVALSCISSLRHLEILVSPNWFHSPSTILMDLIREINGRVNQLDTLSINVQTPDPITGFSSTVSSDHTLVKQIQEYIRRDHATADYSHRWSGRLIVRTVQPRPLKPTQ